MLSDKSMGCNCPGPENLHCQWVASDEVQSYGQHANIIISANRRVVKDNKLRTNERLV